MESKIYEINEKYIEEYIEDMLASCSKKSTNLSDDLYHHNTSYENAPSICKYGILTINDLIKNNICNYTEEQLKMLSNIYSHVNDVNTVSLALVGLQDLYPGEEEFNPYSKWFVDFIVSREVKTGRCSFTYGNEFLSYSSINPDKLKAVDIRLLELMHSKEPHIINSQERNIIGKYNCLRQIANAIIDNNMNLPMREMSENSCFDLDVEKISKNPILILKK